jgi:SSS family solute:Na+ symporter
VIVAIFTAVIALSIGVAFYARRGATGQGIRATLVAGRSLPAALLFFLAVGEIYSIGTMLGFPGGIYANGASYGVWFIGYILMGYILGYVLAPLVWRAAKRHDAMTVPDVFRGHFGTPLVEKLAAVTFIIALVPWAVFQFVGLQTVLGALGIRLTATQSVAAAGMIAFVYVAASGMRSTAFVALLKDVFMLLGIVLAGLVAVFASHGVPGVFAATAHRTELTTVGGAALVFAMSTIVLQSMQFYLTLPAQFIFSAKSEGAVKKSVVWMPLYMLMYPLLVFAAYYGIGRHPNLSSPDSIFLVVTKDLASPGVVGLVAAGAGLAGLIVLAGTALMFSGVLSRNLMATSGRRANGRVVRLLMAGFLVGTAVLTSFSSTIMLTYLSLALSLMAQLVPAWLAVLFFRRLRSLGVAVGLVIGVGLVAVFFFDQTDLHGLNGGLVALVVNIAIATVISVAVRDREPAVSVFWQAREILTNRAVPGAVEPAAGLRALRSSRLVSDAAPKATP